MEIMVEIHPHCSGPMTLKCLIDIDHIYMVYPQSDSFIIEMAKNRQKIIVPTVRCDRSRLENVPIAQEISDMLDIG